MILGIDPGLSGALVLFEPSVGTLHAVLDMPVFTLARGGAARREIDLDALHAFLYEHRTIIQHAYLERVGPMPRQGVASTYQFGRGVGQIEGMLASLAIPVTYVAPQVWRAKARVRDGKDGSLKKARELFPEIAQWFAKAKSHGRAEAALIAWVGSEKLED